MDRRSRDSNRWPTILGRLALPPELQLPHKQFSFIVYLFLCCMLSESICCMLSVTLRVHFLCQVYWDTLVWFHSLKMYELELNFFHELNRRQSLYQPHEKIRHSGSWFRKDSDSLRFFRLLTWFGRCSLLTCLSFNCLGPWCELNPWTGQSRPLGSQDLTLIQDLVTRLRPLGTQDSR